MSTPILVAVDDFNDSHIDLIREAVEGWGAVKRIPQGTPEAGYRAELARAEIAVGWPKPEWIPESALHYLQLGSVGYENFLKKGLETRHNFTLCNARGVMNIPVAEHCVAMMFALARRLPGHMRDQVTTVWQNRRPYMELAESTACIIGLGAIGGEIARMLTALNLNVIAVSTHHAASGHPNVRTVCAPDKLHEALKRADHVVLSSPARPDGSPILGRAEFQAIKQGACIYNVGRGSLIDEAALLDALNEGRVSGAGLDVFQKEPLPADSPFWQMPNVLITPHIAGRSNREFDRLLNLFVSNLGLYRRREPLTNTIPL